MSSLGWSDELLKQSGGQNELVSIVTRIPDDMSHTGAATTATLVHQMLQENQQHSVCVCVRMPSEAQNTHFSALCQ